MPLDSMRSGQSDLDDFRVSSPREVAAMLRQLCDGNVRLTLISSDGSAVGATIWTVDTNRTLIGFNVDGLDPKMSSLLDCQEATVVGYVDSVKMQFDVQNLVLVRSPQGSVLNCSMPTELFRFQRRNAFRVRPLARTTPMARFRHSSIAEMSLELRVLDVSIGGCALFLPNNVPALQPGSLLNQVNIELDADTRFNVNLRLQHVTSLSQEATGVRLGCEFVSTDSGILRALQLYIDQTQKKAKLLSG